MPNTIRTVRTAGPHADPRTSGTRRLLSAAALLGLLVGCADSHEGELPQGGSRLSEDSRGGQDTTTYATSDTQPDTANTPDTTTLPDTPTATEPACDTTTCTDENPCTFDYLTPPCTCVHTPLPTPCDDGNPCTTGDTCATGTCAGLALPATACDDQNPCTADTCDPTTGCVHKSTSGDPCSDNNPCTGGDACEKGSCAAGPKLLCTCQTDQDCTKQDDNNPCTGVLACDKSGWPWTCAVKPNSVPLCPQLDGAQCLATACNPANGKCDLKPSGEGQPCSDGNACTSGDHCQGGACLPAAATTCDDQNPCTVDLCDLAAGCQHSPVLTGTACDADSSLCTVGDSCVGAVCQAGTSANCDDGQVCTGDSCDAKLGCQHTAQDGPCSDGIACTTGDHCLGGVCLPNGATSCDDGEPCTADSCDLVLGCQHAPATGAACDDGSWCTVGEHCSSGACQPAGPLDCDDLNPCTSDSCDASQGCVHLANAATCTDGNPCTLGDHCQAGQCLVSAWMGCDDGVACTIDSCQNPGGCVHEPANGLCDDGLSCTGDACSAKLGCVHLPVAATCSDGNACTLGDSCKQGACVTSGAPDCDDKNPCTVDSCAAASGCKHAPVAADLAAADVCPAGCTLVPVDGVSLCFADFPVWGELPDTPTTLTDQGGGTVLDSRTGLTWMKVPVPNALFSWAGGVQACDASTLAGATNWRLPTATEIETTADYQKLGGATAFLPWFPSQPYGATLLLTTTLAAGDSTKFWPIGDDLGGFGTPFSRSGNAFAARCVH